MLNTLVERKRRDDLAASIKERSNRYLDQKARMRESGIEHIVLMIEKEPKGAFVGLPEATLLQASVNTQVLKISPAKLVSFYNIDSRQHASGADDLRRRERCLSRIGYTTSAATRAKCDADRVPTSKHRRGKIRFYTSKKPHHSRGARCALI